MTQRMYPQLFSASIFFCLLGLIVYPEEALDASSRGLDLWWTIVFPSLLPFFILSDLLPNATWTNYIGRLLEKVMKPIFRVSGQGAIVMILGFSSGFPVGAKMSVKLFNEGTISRADAQRLICYTNGASPIFIIGAIAAGLLQTPQIGLLLLLAHYAGNVIIGIVVGRLIRDRDNHENRPPIPVNNHTPPLGSALQSAVTTSVQQLLVIGGLIVFFSVISEVVIQFSLFDLPRSILSSLSSLFSISPDWTTGFMLGVLEMSNGVANVAIAENDFIVRCVVILSIISFGGFCIHAQILSSIHQSPLSYRPFLYCRIVHSFLSPVLFLGYLYINERYNLSPSLLTQEASTFPTTSWFSDLLQIGHEYGPLITILSIVIAVIFLIKQKSTTTK